MATKQANNATISGAGTVAGGVYDKVTISGAGKVTGDIVARKIVISGAGKLLGHVKAGTFVSSGTFRIEGDLEADEFRCSGAGRILGAANVSTFNVAGTICIGSGLRAKEVLLAGGSKIEGDVEAERFFADGAFRVDGLLNAELIDIRLSRNSHVGQIGGAEICVTRSVVNFEFFGLGGFLGPPHLHAQSIEGDEVYLESTEAMVVRGRNVRIGPECRIDTVEYSESLQIDPQADVKAYAYTGEASPAPAVSREPLGGDEKPQHDRPQISRGPRIVLGRWEVRNPIMKFLLGAAGMIFAIFVVTAVLTAILPAIIIMLAVVFGAVGLLLLAMAVGLPVLGLMTILVKLISLPFVMIRRLWRRCCGWRVLL